MINQYVREHIQYQSYTNKYLGNIKNIWFILVAPKKVKWFIMGYPYLAQSNPKKIKYVLEGFKYATSLDLNMGYYYIQL